MSQHLTANESTLADLLRPGIKMIMPPYQRSYSWEKAEARDLLNDLLEATETSNSHFVGAIVLVRDEAGDLLIVDGQQRLTTLTILLSILRDLETDQARSDALHQLIADEGGALLGGGLTWRISLNHIDGPYFREAIQTRGATLKNDIHPNDGQSQQRMFDNCDALIKAAKLMSTEQRRALVETILERLMLVRVIVPDWDNGYNVFKVLNTRGKAPNSHDIIKTELLARSNLTTQEANAYSRKWSEYETRLGGSGFDDLLNQIRVLNSRNASADPSGFRKAVLSKVDARVFLQEKLPAFVQAYDVISKGNPNFGERDDELKIIMNHLRLIDHLLWRAPALRYIVNESGDPDQRIMFFKKLERFAFIMMLVVPDRKHRLRRYDRIASAIDNPRVLFGARGPLSITKDEARKAAARLVGRFGSFGQRRAIALRLNAEIEGGISLGPDHGATVEHVLPRNLPEGSPWHNSWLGHTNHRDLCETIGNFVLLSSKDNENADNGSFEDKKALYFANGEPEFALTRDVKDHLNWTPDAVRTRSQQLADILISAWELDV
jgi:hypothetical protein